MIDVLVIGMCGAAMLAALVEVAYARTAGAAALGLVLASVFGVVVIGAFGLGI